MNIKDYITKKTAKQTEPAAAQNAKRLSAEEAIKQYGGMSEEGLLQEMRRVAEENRREGRLNDTDLDAFYKNVQAMLTPEQAAKMKNLIEELKR